MKGLLRTDLRALQRSEAPTFNSTPDEPVQLYLRKDPWRVAVASMLLNRTRRAQAEPVLRRLFAAWPCAEALARADLVELESVVRSCGLHRQRARALVRFSGRWLGDGWATLDELPGMGAYATDVVGIVCLGRTEGVESQDKAVLRCLELAREVNHASGEAS